MAKNDTLETTVELTDRVSDKLKVIVKQFEKYAKILDMTTTLSNKQATSFIDMEKSAKDSNTTMDSVLDHMERYIKLQVKNRNNTVREIRIRNEQTKAMMNSRAEYKKTTIELQKLENEERRIRRQIEDDSFNKRYKIKSRHAKNSVKYQKELIDHRVEANRQMFRDKYGVENMYELNEQRFRNSQKLIEQRNKGRLEQIRLRASLGDGSLGGFFVSKFHEMTDDKFVGTFAKIGIAGMIAGSLINVGKMVAKWITSEVGRGLRLAGTILRTAINSLRIVATKTLSFINDTSTLYGERILEISRLELIMRQRLGTNYNGTKNIMDEIGRVESIGVFNKSAISQGVMELATFVNDENILKSMVEPLANMVAQQYGYGATASEWQSMGDMLGRLFAGQTGALGRTGYVFTEEEKAILKGNDALAKRDLIVQSVNVSIGKQNELLGSTVYGKIKQAEREITNIKTDFGEITSRMRLFGIEIKKGFLTQYKDTIFGKLNDAMNNMDKNIIKISDRIRSVLLNMQEKIPKIIDKLRPFLEGWIKIHGVMFATFNLISRIFLMTNASAGSMETLADSISSTFKQLALSIMSIFEKLGPSIYTRLEKIGLVDKKKDIYNLWYRDMANTKHELKTRKWMYSNPTPEQYTKYIKPLEEKLANQENKFKESFQTALMFGVDPSGNDNTRDYIIKKYGLTSFEGMKNQFALSAESKGRDVGEIIQKAFDTAKNALNQIPEPPYNSSNPMPVNVVAMDGLPKEFLDYLKETAMNRFSVHLNSMTPQVTVNNTYNDSSEASHNDSVTKFVSALYTVSSARLVQ